MQLPFSESDFLNVFGQYNAALLPAVILLWIVTVAAAFQSWHRGRGNRVLFALLAVHWAWSGIVYHWLFFRHINPAAKIFGALFVVQAVIFVRLMFAPPGQFGPIRSPRGFLGYCLVFYGLLYPLLGLILGLQYPRLPLFAVPCPTTLVTAGFLLLSSGLPRYAYLVPVLWTAIAGSAAVFLGIWADLALVAAGAFLLVDMIVPNAGKAARNCAASGPQ